MLTLNGVSSRGHVWFRGLDITQSPIQGDNKTFFLNETNDGLVVCIVQAGKSNKTITLAPGERQFIYDMEGEYFLSIVAIPLADDNSSIGEMLIARLAQSADYIANNTYNADLIVSAIEHNGTEVS